LPKSPPIHGIGRLPSSAPRVDAPCPSRSPGRSPVASLRCGDEQRRPNASHRHSRGNASSLRHPLHRRSFAGNYVLTYWGCGRSCVMGAVIDTATGEITWLPFSVCCATSTDPGFRPINFKPNTRLVVFTGLRNEEQPMGAHFYSFDGREFHFITMVPDDGIFIRRSTAQ
jgi:hypothetical protein